MLQPLILKRALMTVEFWIDRGGTFTDCILFNRETNEYRVIKVLSADDAPLRGMRQLLGLGPGEPLPPCDVRMGTTVATNALLERNGARTALVITRGFADLLVILDQTRPDLFALNIQKPAPLAGDVFEIGARFDPNGAIVELPTEDELAELASKLASSGVESVALVVLHAYAAPDEERALRDRLVRHFPPGAPAPFVVASTEAVSEIGFVGRASTATVDAYLTPLLRAYLQGLRADLGQSSLSLMQSSGGLARAARFRGPASLLSGPAGGLIAAARIAKQVGSEKLVTFDMGGTSTDVSLLLGAPSYRYERSLAGVNVHEKMMDIHTIAAGGGSICFFDGYGLCVGPRSVGAAPGPVCYGRQVDAQAEGTEVLALTDINLLLGRVAEDHFPFPLDRSASLAALENLTMRISKAAGRVHSPVDIARGFHAVASTHMVEAIRQVAVERGADLRDADLLVFGGAAGQHACDIANLLGMRRVLVHRLSGVLSAFGIGQANASWSGERDAGRIALSPDAGAELQSIIDALCAEGLHELAVETTRAGASAEEPRVEVNLDLRYRGTDSVLSIAVETEPSESRVRLVRQAFEEEHLTRFGFTRAEATVEVVTVRLNISLPRDLPSSSGPSALVERTPAIPLRKSPVTLGNGEERDIPVYELASLIRAKPLVGPALLLDPTGTYLVDQGFVATLQADVLIIERDESLGVQAERGDHDDVATVQIMARRLSSIAEQMGEALRRTASSTNIRDRLDFSCALFDRRGNLVANAPHIPVHLGAMSESVKAVLSIHPEMKAGQAFITNDPALGGSHLPDITLVSPVFSRDGDLVGFTASRGHHADVGGTTPGSMPANSRCIAEEGVVLSALLCVNEGKLLEEELRNRFLQGDHPARNVGENLADIQAALAANQLGSRLLLDLEDESSSTRLEEAMDAVRRLAAQWMRDALSKLPNGPLEFSDVLDDGSAIRVRIEKVEGGISIDFSGSSAEHPGNLNAPRAVTLACVLYALRAFLNRPLPLNQGCLDPVKVIIPSPSILDPGPDRAVAAGNVETSQRIVDVLLGALRLVAASQGTMNNLSLGNERFGYYETLAGGSGAGPDFDGASAVHTHMTNTRITDPELLEARFPVRVLEFCVRRGSGGAGRFRGGDGIVREIQALEPLEISLLTSRRETSPFGLDGGAPGSRGRNFVRGVQVGATFSGIIQPGETVRIETPGGGGYGLPE